MRIGIIGAGASGMAAALAAAENPNAEVILFERQARVGRKLQATGNGRCNLTNLNMKPCAYHGDRSEFAATALAQFTPSETLAWFQRLGLFTVAEPSGRVYPYSDQANSVVDVLRFALEKPNIELITGFEVEKIQKENNVFTVFGNDRVIVCDKLIVACGGLAGTKLGGGMSGYKLLAKFGHKSTKLRPSLVQLKSSWPGIVSLKGIRANCKAEIYYNGVLFASGTGEVQFTEYGLSGPVIFEISRDACQGKGEWVCKLDLMPDCPVELLEQELANRRSTQLSAEELLTGVLHNRLGRVVVKESGIAQSCKIAELSDYDIQQVCRSVKCFEIALTEPMGMDAAQVTAGGVLTDSFDPETMESLLVPGLYACGEVLDIDGDCGGFNLQWAWSSGRCAGLSAGKE